MPVTGLPPAPPGRSRTIAASTPAPVHEAVAPGAVTGMVLALWAWLIGAQTWALVTALAAAGLGSLWLHLVEDTEWVGEDWIASRGLGPTLVVDLADIAGAHVPYSDARPSELVVAHRNGCVIRVDFGHLSADRAFGDAVLALVDRAQLAGADVSPDVRHLADGLGRRCA